MQRLLSVLVLLLLVAVAVLGVAVLRVGSGVSAPARQEAHPRDSSGDLIVTDEDVEFFSKVQAQVLRRQRIESQTRGAMLRIDRLASRGEITSLPDERRKSVETILRNYLAKGDDLTARYLRSPDERDLMLTAEQRRDELVKARTELISEAQKELEPIMGPDDSKKIADEALRRPWFSRVGQSEDDR